MHVTYCADRSVLIVLYASARIHIFHIFTPDWQEAKLFPLSIQLLKHYSGLVIKYYLSLQACHNVWGLLAGKMKTWNIYPQRLTFHTVYCWDAAEYLQKMQKSLPPFYLLPTSFMTSTVSTNKPADKIKFFFPAHLNLCLLSSCYYHAPNWVKMYLCKLKEKNFPYPKAH